MKVQIKDLEPNPYRDMKNYPMDEVKIKNLVASIKQTGFWDNILARLMDGKYQLAYGHHRLAAIKQVMKLTDIIDIPVKELDDATMIKIMAKENDDDLKATPKVIDETVRITKKFLEEHPDEIKKLSIYSRLTIVGADMISKFLGWGEWKVANSLERLKLIEDKIIDKEAIERLPSDYSARVFIKAVKNNNLPLNKQNAAIDKILDTKRSERDIEDAILSEKYPKVKIKKSKFDDKIKHFEDYIAETRNLANDFSDKLQGLIQIKDEFQSDIPVYEGILQRGLLLMSVQRIKIQFEQLTNTKNNEKVKQNRESILRISE